MRRVRVVVGGRVQGVFFRASCSDRARELGLAGWVRNAEDGRVEAEFEGASRDVDAMMAWCRAGPPYARVEVVEVVEVEPRGDTGFHVRG